MSVHAYIIADVKITNAQQYEEYKKLSTHAIEKYGAKIHVRGGQAFNLEGDWQPTRVVVMQFPDINAARIYYNSPEYTKARQAREGAAIVRMILVEGV